MYIIYTLYTEV